MTYNFNGNVVTGSAVSTFVDNNLAWEKKKTYNVGIDLALFRNRLEFTAEWYKNISEDLLYAVPVPEQAGVSNTTVTMNAASMNNSGFEFSATYRNRDHDFKYEISGNLSTLRNRVTSLGFGTNSYISGAYITKVGEEIGQFYGWVYEGIARTQEDLANHATQEGAGLGRIRWRDLDGNGIINEKDQQWIYNPTPDFSYGLNIYLEYKNFDLTMFWQGVQGVDVISDLKKETDLWSGLNIGFLNKGKRVLDAWSPTNPNSTIPALSRSDTNNEKRVSTYFVENGSFLKLRNIQLGYNVPKNFAQKMKMERLRFYLSAQNVFTIKSKEFTGVDPENANYGYPIPMNITFGINVGF